MKKIITLFLVFLFPLLSFSQESDTDDDNQETYKPKYSAPFAQPKFVPNISLVADFSYAYRNHRDDKYKLFEVPGFIDDHNHSGHEGEEEGVHSHTDSPGMGFNLNYGELSLQAAVDPYFDLFSNFHLAESEFGIEELYFSTRSMPFNFKVKAGRFLSSFGRLNSQHAHLWNFNDLPVVYNAFFGTCGLLENGAQLSWLAPTDFYFMIGGEVLQGDNSASFGSTGYTVESSQKIIESSKYPNVYSGFIKTSFGTDDLVILTGLSCAIGDTRRDQNVNEIDGQAINARTSVYGADLTIKYLIDSYRYISIQGEYLYRHMDGYQYLNAGSESELEKKQSGMYAQLIVKLFKQWLLGIRYDLLQKNEINISNTAEMNTPENMDRYSSMIEFHFSEFSRFRLQYNYDRTKYLEERQKKVQEVVFACNLAIGAHGAHKF